MTATVQTPIADAATLAALLNLADAPATPWSADLADVTGDLAEIAVYAPAADPAAVVGLVGYVLRGPLAMFGEWYDESADVDGDGVIRFAPDLTKSRRDDVYGELSDPATGLLAWLQAGSPVRKTDRSGPGTKGTRAWSPVPGPVLVVWR